MHVISSTLPDHHVGGAEHRQVLGDGGLRHIQPGDEGVHAERVPRLQTCQKRDQTETGPVTESLIDADKMLKAEGIVNH